MTWRPMTEQHAIERVRVTLAFDRPIPPKKVRALGMRVRDHMQGLGFGPIALQSGQAIAIQVSPGGQPVAVQQPQEVNGWTFQNTTVLGVSTEAFQLADNALLYEITEYTRWASFLERFEAVAADVVSDLLALDDASLSLEYHDRFWFEGPPNEAVPSQLLRWAEAVVPSASQDGADLWHVHRGWFEAGQHGRLLIQHNIDAQDEAVQGLLRRVVRMVTRSEGRKGVWTVAEDNLRPHLDIMHDRTKAVFAEALTDEVCSRVGINRENLNA